MSEVMLQQTQAARVVRAYERFLRLFPTARSLAAAPTSAVVRAWDGLGHNRRAVALGAAAAAIVRDHDGAVPRDPTSLRALPGIGPYTAAALASIAFGAPVPAVDTNVRRVVSRVFGVSGEDEVQGAARRWLDLEDPGGWNQALMDLGREVCRPRPRCATCPLESSCRSAHAAAEPRPRARAEPFEGSMRQVRGGVVRALRRRRSAGLDELVGSLGRELETVAAAVRALDADGLVSADYAALEGRPRGRVRLR